MPRKRLGGRAIKPVSGEMNEKKRELFKRQHQLAVALKRTSSKVAYDFIVEAEEDCRLPGDNFHVKCPHHTELLEEMVLKHLGWIPCQIHQLRDRLQNDYGSVGDRRLLRTVERLGKKKLVITISPGRDGRGKPLPGWLVRYDHPLLWVKDGLRTLLSIAEDL